MKLTEKRKRVEMKYYKEMRSNQPVDGALNRKYNLFLKYSYILFTSFFSLLKTNHGPLQSPMYKEQER
jgi:hypothetical protein